MSQSQSLPVPKSGAATNAAIYVTEQSTRGVPRPLPCTHLPLVAAVERGDFIEDTIGQRAGAQMKEGWWDRGAYWLYYPGECNLLCLRHLNVCGEGESETH